MSSIVSLMIAGSVIYIGYVVSKNSEKILQTTASRYVLARSEYVWTYRPQLSEYNAFPFIKLLDKVFKIDSYWAKLNSSKNLKDRVVIENATITSHEQQYMCVTDEMRSIVTKRLRFGDSIVKLNLMDVFNTFGYIQDKWRIMITYKGHSNPSKKIEARTFQVVYDLHVHKDFQISFPPYPVDEGIKVGFGVPRIKSVETDTGEDLMKEAKEFAGLHANFYQDCSCENVVKSYMEEDAIVLTTKGKFEVGPLV